MTEDLTKMLETEASAETDTASKEDGDFISSFQESGGDADYLTSLVGEGKKYKDVQALAKAYAHLDIHTNELKEKLDNRLATEERINEILDHLKRNKETPKMNTSVDPGKGIEEVDIDALVEQSLQKRTDLQTRTANKYKTKELLIDAYGSETAAGEVMRSLPKNGMRQQTVDALNALAETDPESAVKFVTALRPPQEAKGAAGSVGMTGTKSSGGDGVKVLDGYMTWTEARELRRTNKDKYWSSTTRDKLTKALAAYTAAGLDYYST